MPIRQEQMLEQIREARAIYTYATQLREGVLTYLSMLSSRYPESTIAAEIANGLSLTVRLLEKPDDRTTFDNERYYQRHAKGNSEFREVQERKRRERGVPTQEEAIAMLHARNAILRAGGEVVQTYAEFNRAGPKEQKITRGKKKREEIKWPRDDPDDKPLEFDMAEDLAPFANLKPPADAKDLQTGLDIQPIAGDNGIPTNEEE